MLALPTDQLAGWLQGNSADNFNAQVGNTFFQKFQSCLVSEEAFGHKWSHTRFCVIKSQINPLYRHPLWQSLSMLC